MGDCYAVSSWHREALNLDSETLSRVPYDEQGTPAHLGLDQKKVIDAMIEAGLALRLDLCCLVEGGGGLGHVLPGQQCQLAMPACLVQPCPFLLPFSVLANSSALYLYLQIKSACLSILGSWTPNKDLRYHVKNFESPASHFSATGAAPYPHTGLPLQEVGDVSETSDQSAG